MEEYGERYGYGELTFRGHADDEESTLETFWEEYNQKIVGHFNFHPYSLNSGEGLTDMLDMFQEHIHDWRVNFEWKKYESDDESDDEDDVGQPVGVVEVEADGKKYLFDPDTGEAYDYLKFMEHGDTEEIGVLRREPPPRNFQFIPTDDLMVWIPEADSYGRQPKLYYTKEEYFGDGEYATDTNEDNIEAINDWCDKHNVGGDAESNEEN